MNHLDLFSGIGGFSIGFERTGFQTLGFSEIEAFPCSVLEHHWPDVPNYGDIRQIDGEQFRGKVDVITFGSPCQDLSVAGKRAGFKGERSGLFHEAIRVIAGARPAFAIWENVPGALSSNGGHDFAAALDAMADIGALDIAWRVLDAQYFGVPQRRRRIFVVADFRGYRAREVLFESESLSGNSKKSREKRQELADTLGGGSGTRGWADDTDRMTFIPDVSLSLTDEQSGQRNDPTEQTFVSSPIAFHCMQDPIIGDISPALSQGNQQGISTTAIAFDTTQITHPENRSKPELDKPCHSLSGEAHPPALAYPLRTGRRIADSGGNAGNVFASGMAVRRLTPRECERLQGFPDDWTNIPGASDSARYRTLGNAVAVPVAEWIARRLAKVLTRD